MFIKTIRTDNIIKKLGLQTVYFDFFFFEMSDLNVKILRFEIEKRKQILLQNVIDVAQYLKKKKRRRKFIQRKSLRSSDGTPCIAVYRVN